MFHLRRFTSGQPPLLRDKFLKNNRAAAREFVADYAKAGSYISSVGDKVPEISKKYLKADDEVLNLSLKWISYKDLRINEGDYNELIRNMKELNLINTPPLYKLDFVS